MALKDIVGQERALEILKGFIRKRRIPHALLFAGEEGIGKKHTAINFAKTLNCTNNLEFFSDNASQIKNQEVDCCDKCPSCRKTEKLFMPDKLAAPEDNEDALKKKIYISHPDIALLMPYKGRIRIKVITGLQEFLSYKPFEGEWKVAIIDNAERLNMEASNAFLKTLEAPPDRCLLIMVTSRPEMLLPTILSRCQRVNFSRLPHEMMGRMIEERIRGIDHSRARLLSELSGGRPGYALAEDLISQRDKSFGKFMDLLGDAEKDVWEDREAMERWFEWSQLWLRDIAVLKATERPDFLINSDRTAEIEEIARKAELKDILMLAGELRSIRELLNNNLNKQLTFNYTGLLLRKMLRARAR